jgi:hypothetical protein
VSPVAVPRRARADPAALRTAQSGFRAWDRGVVGRVRLVASLEFNARRLVSVREAEDATKRDADCNEL